jgi:hypothetical protein
MSDAELDAALAELEEVRKTAEGELAAIENRREMIEQLERDKEALLDHYAAIAPEALDYLTLEERHQLYKMLRLEVFVRPDAKLEVGGVFGEGLPVSNLDSVPAHCGMIKRFMRFQVALFPIYRRFPAQPESIYEMDP